VSVGAIATIWATRALHAYLFGVTATDQATYLIVGIGLPLIALAACWRPARRAARIDPMTLLRQ